MCRPTARQTNIELKNEPISCHLIFARIEAVSIQNEEQDAHRSRFYSLFQSKIGGFASDQKNSIDLDDLILAYNKPIFDINSPKLASIQHFLGHLSANSIELSVY